MSQAFLALRSDFAPSRLWIPDDQGLDPGSLVLKEVFQAAVAAGDDSNTIDYIGDGDGDDYGDSDHVERFLV